MKKFGMQTAFNDKADFTKMFSEDALISKMFQKAFIKVDEEGAEATAADVAITERKCLPPKKASFYANRPFLFFIIHNKTKTILFAGCLVTP